MKNILIYTLIGVITVGILEMRQLMINKELGWKERLTLLLIYPVVVLNLLVSSKDNKVVVGYSVVAWILYNILNTL